MAEAAASSEGLVVRDLSSWRHLTIRTRGSVGTDGSPPANVVELEFPCVPNRISGIDPCLCWMAPGEWLLSGSELPEDVERKLAASLGERLYHIAQVTDGVSGLELRGQAATRLLSKGCSLDLHPASFPAGSSARSLLAGLDIVLQRPEADLFRLFFDATHGAYMETWLDQSMRDFPGLMRLSLGNR